MDGRQKRSQRIIDRIKEVALELFTAQGVENVSMDEIARLADVSKVTIYKHFQSKDALHRAVIDLYSDRVLASVEAMLSSDLDFMEKFRLITMAQVNRPQMASSDYLFEMLAKDARAGGRLAARLKQIVFRFYEEGQRGGYIDKDLPFEIFYLYSEIYQAGYQARLAEAEAILVDKDAIEKMTHLFFFGVIRRDP